MISELWFWENSENIVHVSIDTSSPSQSLPLVFSFHFIFWIFFAEHLFKLEFSVFSFVIFLTFFTPEVCIFLALVSY